MNDADFLAAVRRNPVNAAILERLPLLERRAPQVHLVAGALFGTVWNVGRGLPPTYGVRDYDLFYWHPDTSYEAEDAVIRYAAELLADLGAPVEVRNQARVHLWFPAHHGLSRPPIRSAREGIRQFLVECTCVGVDARGEVYAPCGLDDLAAGVLRPNPHNHTPTLYAAKVASYQERWHWLRDGAPVPTR